MEIENELFLSYTAEQPTLPQCPSYDPPTDGMDC